MSTREPVTGFWRAGDLHFCALYALAHIADLACEEYARIHGDGMYLGAVRHAASPSPLPGGEESND